MFIAYARSSIIKQSNWRIKVKINEAFLNNLQTTTIKCKPWGGGILTLLPPPTLPKPMEPL